MRDCLLFDLPWLPAASGGLQGSESCMLPSDSSRALGPEALQGLRISSPAEVGEGSPLRPYMQGTHNHCQPFTHRILERGVGTISAFLGSYPAA